MKTPMFDFLSCIYGSNISIFLRRIHELKMTVYCHIFSLTIHFDDINGGDIKGYAEP